MDINLVRSILTLVLLAVFIGIVAWAWSGKRKQAFDAAAQLPFDDEPESGNRRQGRD
jgi:cytochrome c oxidase cbb3-type subunit 4